MLQPLFSDATETAAYADALAVVEFVATFGALCEIHTPIQLSDLLRSIQDPVEHPELGILYHALLTCVLLDQVRLRTLCHSAPTPLSLTHPNPPTNPLLPLFPYLAGCPPSLFHALYFTFEGPLAWAEVQVGQTGSLYYGSCGVLGLVSIPACRLSGCSPHVPFDSLQTVKNTSSRARAMHGHAKEHGQPGMA